MNINKTFHNIAVLGDIVYILWVFYNGINEGFKNIQSVQAVSLLGLIILLGLNIILLYNKK